MKAYKFRPASQIQYAFDIMLNNRLFCADWRQLNDPMEGMFAYSYKSSREDDIKEQVAQVIEQKKGLKVCSLAKTFDCHLLWAHDASGFEGLAIEVELPDGAPEIKEVGYRGVFASLTFADNFSPEQAAEEVLSSKYREWEYEQEVRVLQRDAYYYLPSPVKRVIAGHRMEPALFKALQIVCERNNIELNRVGIGDEGIDADYVEPLNA